MIGKIKGIVDIIDLDSVIIDVAGVGYILRCSGKNLSNMRVGDKIEMLVETHVREDQITLYGFISKQEKQFFLKFTTVKGIGPRLALQILSCLSPDQIFLAITTKDSAVFSKISGVGPKLVNRLFAELKEKDFIDLDLDQNMPSAISNNESHSHLLKNDAISALVNLGVGRSDAFIAISSIISENVNIDLNNLIKLSLNKLSKVGM